MTKIYKTNIIEGLKDLSDINYQTDIWLNKDNPDELVDSFIEAANMLFDDSSVDYYIEKGHVLFDNQSTKALKDLSVAVDAVDEFRSEEEIINDPKMQIVREKAAYALELILKSDGSESTVEIVEEDI